MTLSCNSPWAWSFVNFRFKFILDPDPLRAVPAVFDVTEEFAETCESVERTELSERAEQRRRAFDNWSGSNVGEGLLEEIISDEDFVVRNEGCLLMVKLGCVGSSTFFS